MTNSASLELGAFPPFYFVLVTGLNFLFARVDDMKLESFDGLEMIPREILQQGTKKIAASIRGLVIAQRLKENKDATSFR